jgi:hypothetical protein
VTAAGELRPVHPDRARGLAAQEGERVTVRLLDAGELRCVADVLDPESMLPDLDEPAWADVALPVAPEAGAGGGGD